MFGLINKKSKEERNDQGSIQSSITPDPKQSTILLSNSVLNWTFAMDVAASHNVIYGVVTVLKSPPTH